MARKKQEGNRFFRMDADFFSDRKIKILKARYAKYVKSDGKTVAQEDFVGKTVEFIK